jgi:hypothetical protein
VVKVTTRVVFGTLAAVLAALAASLGSKVVNTVFVERHNGSDRNRNRRNWTIQEWAAFPARKRIRDA